MKTKFLQVLLAFCCFSFCALSQDVLNYYIVYDVSGSVHTIDYKNNLQKSIFKLLEASGKSDKEYRQAISFSLAPFGESINTEDIITYHNSESVKGFLEKMIIDKTQRSRSKKFSDIKAALEITLKKLEKEVPAATGVFIFTDGYFIARDIPTVKDSLSLKDALIKYTKDVDSLILAIEKKVGPGKIFYIQTSPRNPQFQFSNLELKPKEALNNVLKDSCLYSKNYFWISSGVSIDDPGYKQQLEQFIYDANIAIITPNELPLKNEREVAITLQEIFTLRSRLKTANITTGKFQNIELLIKEIDILINKPTLSRDEMATIRLALQKLTDNNNVDYATIKIQKNKPQSPTTDSILDLLNKVNNAELIRYRENLIQLLQNSTEQQKKLQSLSSIALTESYKPAATTLLANEVKQNKGWESLQQNLINGTADYLVKRAKQEVVYSFIENLHKYFEKDPVRRQYMLTFFPTVWQYSENENIQPDLLQIRDAFKKDIKNMPQAIYNNNSLVQNPSMLSFWVFMRFYDELLSNGNLEHTFKILASEMSQKNGIPDFDTSYLKQSILLSLNLISYLNDNDIAAVYNSHNRDSIMKLSKLLYILSIDTKSLRDTSIIVYSLETVNKIVSKIYADYEITKRQIETLKKLLDQSPVSDFEGYRKYHRDLLLDILHRSAALITSGAEIIASQNLENWKQHQLKKCKSENNDCKNQPSDIEKTVAKNRNIINAAQNGIDAWFNIQQEQYKEAIMNLFSVGLALTDKQNNLYNILMISGEIAGTNSPEEVSNVLTKYLLPVASYKTKRNNHWSVMINGYLGIGVNFYHDNFNLYRTGAVHAPIGIEFSRSFGVCNWRSTISLMPTLIDLGNVINYRHISNTNTLPSNEIVSFAGVFSPGMIISVGFSNRIPISFITGYQYNPNRLMTGLALDLPLTGIWKRNHLPKN